METIITRVGYCPHCNEAMRPHYDSQFAVVGKTGRYHIYIANSLGRIGFVPHFYKLIKVIGQNVVYEKSCAMHGCGTDIYFDNEKQNYQFYIQGYERGIMDLTSWNALVQYHDDGYFI